MCDKHYISPSAYIHAYLICKDANQLSYFKQYGRPLLLDYLRLEEERKERIVVENKHWIVVVPFWSVCL